MKKRNRKKAIANLFNNVGSKQKRKETAFGDAG